MISEEQFNQILLRRKTFMARFLRYYNETPLNSEHKKNYLYEMIDSENLMNF